MFPHLKDKTNTIKKLDPLILMRQRFRVTVRMFCMNSGLKTVGSV